MKRSKQNNVKMGLSSVKNVFRTPADNPSTLLTAAPIREKASPPDSLKKSTDQQGFNAININNAGTGLIIALAAALLDLAGCICCLQWWAITKLVFLCFSSSRHSFFLVAKRGRYSVDCTVLAVLRSSTKLRCYR